MTRTDTRSLSAVIAAGLALLLSTPAATAQARPAYDCGVLSVRGSTGATVTRLQIVRAAPAKLLSCRRARALARFAWKPSNQKPGDPGVLADPAGWDCHIVAQGAEHPSGECERDKRVAFFMFNRDDRGGTYVPQ
jgi:hypothetical protein